MIFLKAPPKVPTAKLGGGVSASLIYGKLTTTRTQRQEISRAIWIVARRGLRDDRAGHLSRSRRDRRSELGGPHYREAVSAMRITRRARFSERSGIGYGVAVFRAHAPSSRRHCMATPERGADFAWRGLRGAPTTERETGVSTEINYRN